MTRIKEVGGQRESKGQKSGQKKIKRIESHPAVAVGGTQVHAAHNSLVCALCNVHDGVARDAGDIDRNQTLACVRVSDFMGEERGKARGEGVSEAKER
jgi:hypothetical protein